MKFSSALLICLLIAVLPKISIANELNVSNYSNKAAFTSWQGIEPDKWATVWLLKRYLSPEAYFLFTTPNSALAENAIPFGVNDAPLKRANRESMFRRLKNAADVNTPEVEALDTVIHDLEVNIWDTPKHSHTARIETLYRQLQQRYDRDQVPTDCYLQFFDGVAELITQKDASLEEYEQKLNLKQTCPGLKEVENKLVEQVDHLTVLREISLGKKVVFIDTREQEEFDEIHLPGAEKLSLRDVNQQSVAKYQDVDLLVPYCIKDFRGFEVAKAMKLNGAKRVATLSPNGLKGWVGAALPTVTQQNSEAKALSQLLSCATEPSKCLDKES